VLYSDTVPHFHDLVGDSFMALDPATARLVGPTYGIAFDAAAVTSRLEGPARSGSTSAPAPRSTLHSRFQPC